MAAPVLPFYPFYAAKVELIDGSEAYEVRLADARDGSAVVATIALSYGAPMPAAVAGAMVNALNGVLTTYVESFEGVCSGPVL